MKTNFYLVDLNSSNCVPILDLILSTVSLLIERKLGIIIMHAFLFNEFLELF